MGEYNISDTQLTAEWEDTGSETSRRCTNCNHTISTPYGVGYASLGKYCPNCGFKMKNPGHIIIEYDYDDY